MTKKKNRKISYNNKSEVWTEEEYEKYLKNMHGMEYIAGYTGSGVPYGITYDKDDDLEFEGIDAIKDSEDEMPF